VNCLLAAEGQDLEEIVRQPNVDQDSGTHAHRLVANVASQMAAAVYEACCSRSNLFYELNPNAQAYVDKTWPKFLDQARITLTDLLNRTKDQYVKDEIADALIKDNMLRRGRGKHVH
jgi:hypothetical protein